jgi:hypothetical protein
MLRSAVTCFLCGFVSGHLEATSVDALRRGVFSPVGDSAALSRDRRGRLCCSRCGGSVFLDGWERVRPVEHLPVEPVLRGRPRKVRTLVNQTA